MEMDVAILLGILKRCVHIKLLFGELPLLAKDWDSQYRLQLEGQGLQGNNFIKKRNNGWIWERK